MYLNNNLSEKEIMKDLLISEKEIADSYNDAILQSACPVLRKTLVNCLSDTQEVQHSVLQAVDKRGWNTIKLVSKREIDNIAKKYRHNIDTDTSLLEKK